MPTVITPRTSLSEARALIQGVASSLESDARLVRSVEQSMRAEGYMVTEGQVRSAACRVGLSLAEK